MCCYRVKENRLGGVADKCAGPMKGEERARQPGGACSSWEGRAAHTGESIVVIQSRRNRCEPLRQLSRIRNGCQAQGCWSPAARKPLWRRQPKRCVGSRVTTRLLPGPSCGLSSGRSYSCHRIGECSSDVFFRCPVSAFRVSAAILCPRRAALRCSRVSDASVAGGYFEFEDQAAFTWAEAAGAGKGVVPGTGAVVRDGGRQAL